MQKRQKGGFSVLHAEVAMRKAVLLFAAAAAGFAPAPFPRPDKGTADLKNMQGQWAQVGLHIAGRKGPVGQYTLTITSNRFQWFREGEPKNQWIVKLDVRGKHRRFCSNGIAGNVKGVVFRGIYRLEGETLTICYIRSKNEDERAKDFNDIREGVWLEVFKRTKP
jgi:uncharacterized protein (TIGR03067 family)